VGLGHGGHQRAQRPRAGLDALGAAFQLLFHLRVQAVGALLHRIAAAGDHLPQHAAGDGRGQRLGHVLHLGLEARPEHRLFPVALAQRAADPVIGLPAQAPDLAAVGGAGEALIDPVEHVEAQAAHFVGQRRGRRHQLPRPGLHLPQAGGVGLADRHDRVVQAQHAIVEHHLVRRLRAMPQPDATAVHQHVVVGAHAALVRAELRGIGGHRGCGGQAGQQGNGGQGQAHGGILSGQCRATASRARTVPSPAGSHCPMAIAPAIPAFPPAAHYLSTGLSLASFVTVM